MEIDGSKPALIGHSNKRCTDITIGVGLIRDLRSVGHRSGPIVNTGKPERDTFISNGVTLRVHYFRLDIRDEIIFHIPARDGLGDGGEEHIGRGGAVETYLLGA